LEDTTRRRLIFVLVVIVGMALWPGRASADGPVRVAVPTAADETFAAAPEGGPCAFRVFLHVVTNNQYEIEFSDAEGNLIRTITQGRAVLEFTNEATGTSVIRNVSGPGTFTVADQSLVARGPWFFAFAPGDLVDELGHVTTEWMFIINRGTFVLRIGDPESGVPHQLISQTGVQENLCETLSASPDGEAALGAEESESPRVEAFLTAPVTERSAGEASGAEASEFDLRPLQSPTYS
jgi:hypothetical protein